MWTDNDVFQSGLHASFKLNASGELVILSNGATFYDQVGFGVQTPDVAYARCPDGGATFAYVQPTYLASNNCFASIEQMNFEVKIFPNPFNEQLSIQWDEQLTNHVMIVDVNGKEMLNDEFTSPENVISTANWSNGMYIVRIENVRGVKTLKIIK